MTLIGPQRGAFYEPAATGYVTRGLQILLDANLHTFSSGSVTASDGTVFSTGGGTFTQASGLYAQAGSSGAVLSSTAAGTLFQSQTAMSVDIWFNTLGTGGDEGVFSSTAGGNNQGFTLRFDSSGFGGGQSNVMNGRCNGYGMETNNNTWDLTMAHFALVFDGSTMKVYINGVDIGESDAAGVLPANTGTNNDRFSVGVGDKNNATPCEFGLFRIYQSALTAAEVLQNFTAERTRFGV